MPRSASRQTRRYFLQEGAALATLGLILGCSRLPQFSQPTEPRRIGFLSLAPEPYHDALFEGLRRLGYVEGRDIIFERRYANGIVVQLPYLSGELVKLPVDVLVVAGVGTSGTNASLTIPMVMVQADAVENGFVKSLARPDRNLTGISVSTPALAIKRLEILKDAFPTIRQVAVLEAGGQTNVQGRALSLAAATLGLTITRYDMLNEVIRPSFEGPFFAAIRSAGTEGLVVLDAPYLAANRARIMAFAAESRLPTIYPQRAFADDGGLMSYGADYADLYRRAATYVDKILHGAKPGDLPVEQPDTLDFVVNLKTAQALGLTVPQALLQQATALIQ